MSTVRCSLSAVCCTLSAVSYLSLLSKVCCCLFAACCLLLLSAVHCLLSAIHWLLSAVCCLLLLICCTLSDFCDLAIFFCLLPAVGSQLSAHNRLQSVVFVRCPCPPLRLAQPMVRHERESPPAHASGWYRRRAESAPPPPPPPSRVGSGCVGDGDGQSVTGRPRRALWLPGADRCWSLIADRCWPLAADRWPLTASHWLLTASYRLQALIVDSALPIVRRQPQTYAHLFGEVPINLTYLEHEGGRSFWKACLLRCYRVSYVNGSVINIYQK